MFKFGMFLRACNLPCWLAMQLPRRIMSGWVAEELRSNRHLYNEIEDAVTDDIRVAEEGIYVTRRAPLTSLGNIHDD